jgi:hypothetical protein
LSSGKGSPVRNAKEDTKVMKKEKNTKGKVIVTARTETKSVRNGENEKKPYSSAAFFVLFIPFMRFVPSFGIQSSYSKK